MASGRKAAADGKQNDCRLAKAAIFIFCAALPAAGSAWAQPNQVQNIASASRAVIQLQDRPRPADKPGIRQGGNASPETAALIDGTDICMTADAAASMTAGATDTVANVGATAAMTASMTASTTASTTADTADTADAAAPIKNDTCGIRRRIPGDMHVFRQIDSAIACGEKPAAETALELYGFFINSPIMGDENYAVYIIQNYFLNGRLETGEDNLLKMKLYNAFNSRSLIGMQAPELILEDRHLENIDVNAKKSKYKILYFYDEQCAQCALQSPLIVKLAKEIPVRGIDIFAICTSTDQEKWFDYIGSTFEGLGNDDPNAFMDANPDTTRWYNLFDPDAESDFFITYNVASTPQIFLIDRFGFIIGRNLDVLTLTELIRDMENADNNLYAYIDSIYETVTPSTAEEAAYFTSKFYSLCNGDENLQRKTLMHIYGLFKSSENHALAEAAAELAEKYIVGNSMLWDERTMAETEHALEIFRKNPVGDTIRDLELSDMHNAPVRLHGMLRGNARKVVTFYSSDCPVCTAAIDELERIRKSSPDTEFVYIYTGSDYNEMAEYLFNALGTGISKDNAGIWLHDCEGISGMFEKFSLETVPSIYLLDKDNRIIAKDISPFTLKGLLPGF